MANLSGNGFGEVRTIEDERGVREEAWRLFRNCSLLSVLIDAQPQDLRFQSLAWYPEFRGCSGRSGNSTMRLRESILDHFHFTIFQCRKVFGLR